MTARYLALICLLLAVPCAARIITVDDDGPADFNNIQAAIDNANDGDVIIVQPGRYTGDGNRDIDFLGKPITVRSTDPNDSQVVATTTIDGGGDPFDLHHGFIFKSGENRDAILAGLTITNFHAPDEPLGTIMGEAGAGIYCVNSSPTISRCAIISNSAYHPFGTPVGLGGGIYCGDGGGPLISRCTITGNGGRFGAGGVHCEGGSCIIEHCLVADNGSGWSIGGIVCGGDSVVTDCTVTNNYGGGIGCGGNAMVSHCIVEGNSYSGGISAWGNAVVSYCTITGNSAKPDWIVRGPHGGGISCGDNALIRNCVVNKNYSQYYPGDQFGGKIEGNAGGVFCYRGSPTIMCCTITRNSADDYGGGIYCRAGNPQVINCIVWQNKAANDQQIGGKTSVSYSTVEGGFAGQGNIDAAPCFADPNNGDYHLKSQAGRWDANEERWTKDDVTSPCIDAGDPMSPIGYEPFPNGGRINMGAYGGTKEASKSYFGEPVCETIVPGDINGDCIVDFKDFDLMALHWLECNEPNQGEWRLVEDDTEDSYSCEGNFDISYPCSNAVDEDWDTYALPADPGATSYIYENYVIPSGIAMADFRIKYQQTAPVTPGLCTTVTDYWDGNAWTALNCTALSNQISTLTVRIPHDALNRNTLQLRTAVWKGRALPGSGSGMYYEGEVIWYFWPVCETIIAGDINGDCKVDWADLALMARHWLQESR